MWKPMLPKLIEQVPYGNSWLYEVKYDGFRASLLWNESTISLISRNGNDLSANFPEIISFCNENQKAAEPYLPLQLDGELVILNTSLQANFPLLQQRGRLKQKAKISQHAKSRPATYLCFDLLKVNGESLEEQIFSKRKQEMTSLFTKMNWPLDVKVNHRIGLVKAYRDFDELWDQLQLEFGEGVVAKSASNRYEWGRRVEHWLKIKNWRKITGIITSYDPNNQYFSLGAYDDEKLVDIGVVKHGFSKEEMQTLTELIYTQGKKTKGGVYTVPPGIYLQIKCLNAEDGQIREPMFDAFRFDIDISECTIQKVEEDLAMLPSEVERTNPEKTLWPKPKFTKRDLLIYLRRVAPYMLPRLYNKKLTLIRYPHGITDESFYQKHRPEYAPDFLGNIKVGDEDFIICNNVASLIWIGNQGAIEFHIPFQRANDEYPDEIVFDLDPPSRKDFQLAIIAAQLLKNICDHLELITYVKTSGNKGLQVHIPLPNHALTYDETREFTEAIAALLVQHQPDLFTIERLKKKRGKRLYVDYVQHAEGKTIIAPYSPRATDEGTVAAPLFWEEVTDELKPTDFTLTSVPDRILLKGCPWIDYHDAKEKQNLNKLKQLISK